MLQWMGGSRRKVTATRKSTQKRQKQYFEQRRRQQQHQQEAADGENYFEGKRTYGQKTANNRSLDICSLLNLSAIAQEHKSSCPIDAREKSEDDALNYQSLPHFPVVQSSEAKTQEHSEIGESRTSSGYQMGITYPKMISVSAPGNRGEALKTDGGKMNQLKMAPDCQLSVIDILGDDEPISSCEKSLVNEAHVAFSIEGLGTVGKETPVHSPEAYSRSFLHGCSSPSKATETANSSQDLMGEIVDLEPELDAMMRDFDLAFCGSSVEQHSCSKNRVDSFSMPKQKLAFEEFSLFGDGDSSIHGLLGEYELFYGSKSRNEDIWNASGILPDNILDESGFHLSDKNWMDPTYTSADFFNSMDCRKKQFAFEGSDRQEKRASTMRKACRLEPIESPAPNFEDQKLENFSNFTFPDIKWYINSMTYYANKYLLAEDLVLSDARHSSIGRDHDFWDFKDELRESCFITEDRRESLSLQSEESCSSTAVREAPKKTSFNSKDQQPMRDRNDICLSESVCSEKNISPRERNCDKWNTPLKGDISGPGKFMRMSTPSRSVQVPQLHTISKKRLKPDHSRYFEEVYDIREKSSGRNSSYETFGKTKHDSSGCRLRTEDLLCTMGDTKSGISSSMFQRFSQYSAKCSPCCNFTSETHDFCHPNLQNMSWSSMQNTFRDSTPGYKPHKSLDLHNCLTPEKESIARDADENSGVQVTDHGKFEPQRDALSGSKSLSSEKGKSTDASDSEVKYRDCKEPAGETPSMYRDSTQGNKPHKSLDLHDCLAPEKESIARDADENSGVRVTDHGKFELQRDAFTGSKSFSSGNGKSTDAYDSEVKCRDCKEPTCETPNMGESEIETNCFQQGEETLSSLGTSTIFDGKQCNADRKCQYTHTSLLCQTGFGDIEDSRPEQRMIGLDVQSTAESTCQVMMFDSCVLQLLCVQVLKEVSA